ncbi:MAG TPA: guanylate kinase [Gemmatimonadales bacterium]|nr:guanylate kinase [Gemmatimonadales bacterium]
MKPSIVVLSAPSGGGKTTIAKAVRDAFPDRFGFSVSATTRKPRAGEKDGEAYHFVTRKEFVRRKEAGEFLESAEYAGELYGTLREEVERVRKSGRHVLLDIEVDGAEQVKKLEPQTIRLFILPTSPETWMQRLFDRKSETHAQIRRRLERAREEFSYAAHFDRLVTNDDLASAVQQVVEAVDEGPGYQRNQHGLVWELDIFSKYGAYLEEQLRHLDREIHQKRG